MMEALAKIEPNALVPNRFRTLASCVASGSVGAGQEGEKNPIVFSWFFVRREYEVGWRRGDRRLAVARRSE